MTGVWSLTSEGDSVLRGALTTTEKAKLDSENSMQGSIGMGNMEVEFTGNTVIIQYSYAELFTTEWTSVYGNGSADSLLYHYSLSGKRKYRQNDRRHKRRSGYRNF